jgi:hypothetical protein
MGLYVADSFEFNPKVFGNRFAQHFLRLLTIIHLPKVT